MQSMLNLQGSYGLPLCVSGIAHHLTLSKEIADHDLKRAAIRRQRSQARGELHLHANQEMNTQLERVVGEIEEGEEVNGDLAGVLYHLARSYLACTAKAA